MFFVLRIEVVVLLPMCHHEHYLIGHQKFAYVTVFISMLINLKITLRAVKLDKPAHISQKLFRIGIGKPKIK